VLLASPHEIKPHRSYLVTDYNWRPSILLQLITLLDVPPKNVLMNLLYMPHPVRPESDVLVKMGHVLSLFDRWQPSFVLRSSSSDLEVTAQLQGVVTASHSGVNQMEHERLVFSRGCSLNNITILPSEGRSKSKKSPEAKGEASQGNTGRSPEGSVSGSSDRGTSEGSPEARPGSKGFKAPRRMSDAGGASSTALQDRQHASKVRSAAQALEDEAERNADKAAKKARSSSTGTTSGKGKKSPKGKAPGENADIDLANFPDADQ
jgi:hypothetical protein